MRGEFKYGLGVILFVTVRRAIHSVLLAVVKFIDRNQVFFDGCAPNCFCKVIYTAQRLDFGHIGALMKRVCRDSWLILWDNKCLLWIKLLHHWVR